MNRFIQKKTYQLVLIFIIVLAVFLRFNQLGSNPPSLDWDEVSLGYNAYSIFRTGADEYGTKSPLAIRSFGDNKPPAYVYLDIPFVAIFGLNEIAVRLPAAIIGVLTVCVTYYLVKELLIKWEDKLKEIIALCSTLFLAISPWHLQFSRAAFEGSVGLFFFASGILFFLKGLKNKKWFILSSIFFVGSLYSYYSFILLVPLMIVLMVLLFWKVVIKQKKYLFLFLTILIIFSSPIYVNFVSPSGTGARLSMVTIFNSLNEISENSLKDILINSLKEMEYDKANNSLGYLFHNRRIAFGLVIIKSYFDHFNLNFLFLFGDGGRQHHAVNVGMLYLWDLPFILAGIFFLLKKIDKRIFLLFAWFLIAPLPSAISTGSPHPVRAINMIPAFQIFSAVGLVIIISRILKIKWPILKSLVIIIISLALVLNIIYYLHQYYVHTPIEYGDYWQYGNKQVFQELSKIENKYKKIIITYQYDQPYIYYLFYNKIDPAWYQKNWNMSGNGEIERMKRKIGKYEFRDINWSQDKNLSNTLLIGTPEELPKDATKIIKEIRFLDGNIAYRMVER